MKSTLFLELFNNRLKQVSNELIKKYNCTLKEYFIKEGYNVNNILNKDFFEIICNENGLICNAEGGREFLKIDFTFFSKPPYDYGYSVPQVFIEVEDNIYAQDENGHEICKLAATNAPLKVFITKYHGDWKKEGRTNHVVNLGATLVDRFENMLCSYSEIQSNLFIANFVMIICEIQNGNVRFIIEIWDEKDKCFTTHADEFELN